MLSIILKLPEKVSSTKNKATLEAATYQQCLWNWVHIKFTFDATATKFPVDLKSQQCK